MMYIPTDVADLNGEFGEFRLQNRLLFVRSIHVRLVHLRLVLHQQQHPIQHPRPPLRTTTPLLLDRIQGRF